MQFLAKGLFSPTNPIGPLNPASPIYILKGHGGGALTETGKMILIAILAIAAIFVIGMVGYELYSDKKNTKRKK